MPYKDPEKQREYQRKNYQDQKELWRQRQRTRREINRAYIAETKKSGCSVCGYNKCPDALEFHHPNDDKKFTVSDSARLHSLETLKKEVNRCILVCANCHAEIHYAERNK